MAKLSRQLLERSPEETSRRLCLALLDEAASALARMDDPDDEEALHDFRVALRRLRSLMRAYRPWLRGTGAKALRRRIKALASSTNAARDAEVQMTWLATERDGIEEPAKSGADYLISRLQARQGTAPVPEALASEFVPLREALTKALSRMRLPDNEATNFARATAGVVRKHADVLMKSLAESHSAEDFDLLHRARIEAKRLRYIFEPLRGELAAARPLIKRMKGLQDCLGDLQDTRVMMEEISEALESTAIDEARKLRDIALTEKELPQTYSSQNRGLLALLKTQRARRDRSFAELTAAWTGPAGEAFFERVDRFAERLLHWPATELSRRRFLLSRVPAVIRRTRGQLVREGWLPGREIHERVRATRDGRSVRYVRIVEPDGGPPAEEALTRRMFDEFWPLTEGRRLECRRYELADGARTWRIVDLSDHGIVLATVDASGEVPVPEPIQKELVREVTGVKKYEPEALARASRGKE